MPLAQALISLIHATLDRAFSRSRLSIRLPPCSLPEQEAISILGAIIRVLASHASSSLSTLLNSIGIAVPNNSTIHNTSLAVSALSFAGLGFIPLDHWK